MNLYVLREVKNEKERVDRFVKININFFEIFHYIVNFKNCGTDMK